MTLERIRALPPEDWRSRNPEFQEPKLTSNLALVERPGTVGARYGRTPGKVAIAWTLHNPAVTGAIVGARNPDQLHGIIGAADFRLSEEEIGEIENVDDIAA